MIPAYVAGVERGLNYAREFLLGAAAGADFGNLPEIAGVLRAAAAELGIVDAAAVKP